MVQNKAQLAYTGRTQPSEIERMPYWEYELYVKSIQHIVEEENKRQEEAEKGQSSSSNNYMRQAQRSMPKMPKMPSHSAPNLKMPKL